MTHKILRLVSSLFLVLAVFGSGLNTHIARAVGPWYVTPTGDDNSDCLSASTPCATISGAIGKASDGDTIKVSVGIYTGTDSDLVFINKSITISGGWNASFTTQSGKSIIDGEGTRRGIQVNGFSISVTLENLVVQNCYTGIGQAPGAIFLYGTLVLSNSIIQNNQTTGIYYAAPGSTSLTINNTSIINNVSPDDLDVPGGIHNNGGTVIINNSSISGNSGSGISNESGVVTINTSMITNNHGAAWGAGITNDGYLTIDSSTIDHNTTASGYNIFGGGIFNSGDLTISNSTISNNMSDGQGGGIFNGGTVYISASAIFQNAATVGGGGIYLVPWQLSATLIATNSTVSNNTGGTGGGLYLGDSWNGLGSSANLNNVTITQNVATNMDGTGKGGGIYVQSLSSGDVKNTLVASNLAGEGFDCSGLITSGGHNLIGIGQGCDISVASGDQIGTLDSPLDAQFGDLLANGGPTLTHALLIGSPAINAGDPATCASTDQRGVARPQGGGCDIGAFELEADGGGVTEVIIDIKPGTQTNPINPKSVGKIPVAILSTSDFDAPLEVDKASLTFGRTGDELSLVSCNKGGVDVNGDGLLDLVCHFKTKLTGFQIGDTEGLLKGQTLEGVSIEGRDSVRILK